MLHPYLRLLAAGAVTFIFTLAPAAAAEKKSSAVKTANPVVAIVNGSKIYLSEVEDARTRLPARFKELRESAVYGLLVNSLIDTNLMAAQARRQNLHKEKRHKLQVKRIENQLLERSLLSKKLTDELTEENIKSRYDKFAKETNGRPEVRARHILVDTESKAKEIISELNKGEDFIALAKKNSIGPSSVNGGELGFFSKGQMAPEFSKAAFALVKGEHTQKPIKTQFGWHVIKVEAHRESVAPSYEKARGKISALLSNEVASALIKKLRVKAKIEIISPSGEKRSIKPKSK